MKMRIFALLGLFLLSLLVLGLVVVKTAHADPIQFAPKIYSALEILKSDHIEKREMAISLIMNAKEFVSNPKVKELLEQTVKLLNEYEGGEPFLSASQISQATDHLQHALRLNRPSLNRYYQSESRYLEKLIKLHFFAEHFDQVEMSYVGIERKTALVLITQFIADPRALLYEPDIAELVLGKDHLGNPSSIAVKFILPKEEFELPPGEENKDFKEAVEDILSEIKNTDIPIRYDINQVGNWLFIQAEVIGLQYIPLVESYLRNLLAFGNHNRYVFGVANQIEGLSRWFKNAHLGGQPALAGVAKNASKVLDSIEEKLRSRLFSGAWYEPTVETVKKTVKGHARTAIEHIQKNLEMKIKIGTLTEEALKIERAQAARYIQEIEQKKSRTLKFIDYYVQRMEKYYPTLIQRTTGYRLRGFIGRFLPGYKLMSPPPFSKLPQRVQAYLRLMAAEKAARIRVVTLDRVLKGVSFLIAGYYLYHGVNQMMRTDDPDERQFIWRIYGVKMINNLMYAIPILGETAICLDLGGWLANAILFSPLGIESHIPSVEEVLHSAFNSAENAYRKGWFNMRYVDLLENDLYGHLQIPSFIKDTNMRWVTTDFMIFRRAVEDFKTNDQASLEKLLEEHAYFIDNLKIVARKYILLTHYALNQTKYDIQRSFSLLESKLNFQLFDEGHGYTVAIKDLDKTFTTLFADQESLEENK